MQLVGKDSAAKLTQLHRNSHLCWVSIAPRGNKFLVQVSIKEGGVRSFFTPVDRKVDSIHDHHRRPRSLSGLGLMDAAHLDKGMGHDHAFFNFVLWCLGILVHKEFFMPTISSPPVVKLVGANGQISLGKQYAGRQVLVEEQESGVWLVRTATVIPDNERWLHAPQTAASLDEALDWARTHPASDAQTGSLMQRLRDE